MPLPIYDVPDDPPGRREETLGTKAKFWFVREGERWLFKEGHAGSGEDWAEVLAARSAESLGLPHAQYELATHKGVHGVVSRKIHDDDAALVFGNQVLAEQDPDYPAGLDSRFMRTSRHTAQAVAEALGRDIGLPAAWTPAPGVTSAPEVFGGYLLLDAWIANTDRHHLNWGVIESATDHTRTLAPTFDHAASLGAGLSDGTRLARLCSKDRQYTVAAYVTRPRTRSALFRDRGEPRPLSPLDAFLEWARRCPASTVWVKLLSAVDDVALVGEIAQVPEARMSDAAKAFAVEMLRCNKRRILEANKL